MLDAVKAGDYRIEETGGRVNDLGDRIVSANAYLGAGPIVEALAGGADRDHHGPCRRIRPLFLAPLVHEFGWAMDDWDALGRGTAVGHLLECAGRGSRHLTLILISSPLKNAIGRLAHTYPIGP